MHNFKNAFLEAGSASLAGPQRPRSSRELELEAENEESKAVLGEAHVQLRVWQKGTENLHRSRTSR